MRKFKSTFVSASDRSWLSRLVDFLFPPPQTQRRPSVAPAIIYTEPPKHVIDFRQRASFARMLLRRHIEGKATTRRAWMATGRSDMSWRQARRVLYNAGVIDRKGRPLYSGRDAVLRLNVHLDRVEQMCWQSGRFVAP